MLLDEPTTGLDPAGMRDMRELVRRLAGEGITILLSSHLLNEVEELCNRVAIVRRGSIVYEGSLADLKATAATSYRLRVAELETAERVCASVAGIGDVKVDGDALRFTGSEDAVAMLTVALGRAGVGFTALLPQTASLEELFLGLTEGDPVPEVRDRGRRLMGAVYLWELRKLRSQKRTYLGLGGAVLVPIAFVIALAVQKGGAGPNDVPLARALRDTGLAIPFVVLFFMSIWGLPLVTALVAGDIVASESHNGTLKTILTRSRDRGQVFAGKVCATATYTIVALVAMVAVGLIAGVIEFGWHPLVSLTGTKVSPLRGLGLLAASSAVYAWSLLAIAAFGVLLSTVTRNSAASVVGTLMFALLMQLLGALPGTEVIRPYLLGNQFSAWHGFLRKPTDWAPVIRAAWLCALYAGIPLFAGYLVFLRRDVTGD